MLTRRPTREHVCANTVTLCCVAADITATDEKDQKLKMDPALVESLQNVSANLSEAMQKVSQLTNLVLDNVREIASLKAEILQLKSHTPDRASVQQPVRAAGVETYENVPQLEDSDWDRVFGSPLHQLPEFPRVMFCSPVELLIRGNLVSRST